MNTEKTPDITPEHEKGKQNNLRHSLSTDSLEEAEELFVAAKNRMLDVNGWHEYAGGLSGRFILCDQHGHELHRKAHKDDLVKIDMPGPGENEGGGYDWVMVETIQYDDYPDESCETIAMTLRPVSAPESSENAAAHFFTSAATSTFSIQRRDKEVTATYHGRNEVPNTETGNLMDKARNAIVAVGAMLGFSELQWTRLIKSFLERA